MRGLIQWQLIEMKGNDGKKAIYSKPYLIISRKQQLRAVI